MPRFSGRRLERMQAFRQFRNGRFANSGDMRRPMEGSSFGLMNELLFGGRKRFHPVLFDSRIFHRSTSCSCHMITTITSVGRQYGSWRRCAFRSMTLTATPAQHFSGRGLRDRNATLWSSWVLSANRHRVFYSADTGLNEDLREIGKRFGPFDLMMLEIGASHPAWADIHFGPANALEAFEMLGGGTFLPIHWGTFDLALHSWEEPAETLVSLAEKLGACVITPPLGRPVEPSLVMDVTLWWRGLS